MSPHTIYASKTEHYLKVKKPLLERQRRARVNQYLDTLKTLIAEFQGDDAILRMDKAEMLESAITFMRTHTHDKTLQHSRPEPSLDSFRSGYMNAVNEVSRVMAATPGMSVNVGKAVMTHLGSEFNRLLHCRTFSATNSPAQPLTVKITEQPLSPASSGYHSDCEGDSPPTSPATGSSIWRPW